MATVGSAERGSAMHGSRLLESTGDATASMSKD
jgi:hypothetical protein